MAAESLLSVFVRQRHTATFELVISFANAILTKYNNSPENERDSRAKNGALQIIMSISDVILDKKVQ